MLSTCIVVCSHTKVKQQDEHRPISLFRFPANKMKRGQWLNALGLGEGDIKQHTHICSRHFLKREGWVCYVDFVATRAAQSLPLGGV